MRDILLKADWFKDLEDAPSEIKQKLGERIIEFGVFGKEIDTSNDDWSLKSTWNTIAGNIDRVYNSYHKDESKGVGRELLADPNEVYKCYWEFIETGTKKVTVNMIGEKLGLPQTSNAKGAYSYLYENAGWKNRGVKNWNYSS